MNSKEFENFIEWFFDIDTVGGMARAWAFGLSIVVIFISLFAVVLDAGDSATDVYSGKTLVMEENREKNILSGDPCPKDVPYSQGGWDYGEQTCRQFKEVNSADWNWHVVGWASVPLLLTLLLPLANHGVLTWRRRDHTRQMRRDEEYQKVLSEYKALDELHRATKAETERLKRS